MANYVKATNFTAKDSLPSGNAGKIVKGTEIDTEFTAIASAISSKADLNSPALTGTPVAPTATAGTNTTQLATTAFVNAAVTGGTGALGTMSTQDAAAVAITGGTITGITDLAVADGGTGRSTFTANAVLVGNGASGLNSVAPSTTGNVLTSNGTAWTSAAPAQIGIGSSQTWQDVTASRASGTTYTNSTGKPIQISIVIVATGSNQGNLVINGVTAVSSIIGAVNSTHQYSFIIPNSNTYVLTLSGGSVNRWLELR